MQKSENTSKSGPTRKKETKSLRGKQILDSV